MDNTVKNSIFYTKRLPVKSFFSNSTSYHSNNTISLKISGTQEMFKEGTPKLQYTYVIYKCYVYKNPLGVKKLDDGNCLSKYRA